MFSKSILCGLALSAVIFAPSVYAGKVELTTYYPAPYGEYKHLQTTRDDTINTVNGNNVGAIHLTHPTSGGVSMITFKSTYNSPTDGGYLAYYDDNNTYAYWGDSLENGALVLGVTNDGRNSASDVVVLKSPAAVIADTPSLLVPSGNIGIGTANPYSSLTIHGPKLGKIKNDKVLLQDLYTEVGNRQYLWMYAQRNNNGDSWDTADLYIQKQVDDSLMGFIKWAGGDWGISFGSNVTAYMNLSNNGLLTFPNGGGIILPTNPANCKNQNGCLWIE